MRRQRLDEGAFQESDHRGQDRWLLPASKWKVAAATLLLLLLALLAPGTIARAADEPPVPTPVAPRPGWRLVLEPAFMHRAVTFALANAKRTIIAPAQLTADGSDFLFPTKKEFETAGLDQTTIATNGLADADLALLKPHFVRDRKNVIIYAELRATRPIVASAVLSPKLVDRFRETLGDELLVAVPNRFTAVIFPALGKEYQQYAPMIIEAYRATPFPVSLEVFHVTADGWKAVGIFDDR
jgi:hypothetical protein